MAKNLLTEEFNEKKFLLPESIDSMAAYHAKIRLDRQQYQFRISDCNSTIKLWGDIKTVEDLREGIMKMNALIEGATNMRHRLNVAMVEHLNFVGEAKHRRVETIDETINRHNNSKDGFQK